MYTPPSKEEVDFFKNMINLSNNLSDTIDEKTVHQQASMPSSQNDISSPVMSSKAVSSEDSLAMKNILESFYNVTNDTVTELVNESHTNNQVKEALTTSRTSTGVSIGNYEIRTKINEAKKNSIDFYDVVFNQNNSTIAKDIILYEAARLLTRYLNNGIPLNSKEVRDVLNLEEKYYANRVDAARFKKKAEKYYNLGNSEQGLIFENRFLHAREKAFEAKRLIEKML